MVSIPIIPLPKHCLIEAGTYVLTSKGEITFDDGGEFTADFLASLTGLHKGCNADIRIAFDDTIAEEEGYCLAIGPLGIRITGKKPIGLLYGAESLRQLLEPQIEAYYKGLDPNLNVRPTQDEILPLDKVLEFIDAENRLVYLRRRRK